MNDLNYLLNKLKQLMSNELQPFLSGLNFELNNNVFQKFLSA